MSDNRGVAATESAAATGQGGIARTEPDPNARKKVLWEKVPTDALTRLSNYIGILRTKPLSQVVMSGTHGCL